MAVPITDAMQTSIANLYIAILGRNPEPAGFGAWVSAYANADATPAALDAITLQFSTSPEFIATYDGKTTAAAVTTMYNNILDRDPDAAGLAAWSSLADSYINSGLKVGEAYALVANQFIVSAAANTGTADSTLILGKEATAVAAGTATPTTTYTLTTGVDIATANIFNGILSAASTLNSFDNLTGQGNGGNNSLNISATVAVAALPAALTLTNIQTFNIGGTDDVTINLSAFTSFTTVNASSTGGSLTLTSATATTISGEIYGDTETIAVTGAAATTVNLASQAADAGNFTVTADVLANLNVNGYIDGSITSTAADVTTLTVNLADSDTVALVDGGAGTIEALTLNVSGAGTDVDLDYAAATALTVTGTDDVTIAGTDLAAVEILTVTGSVDVAADTTGWTALATVTAGAATGNVELIADATTTSVTTGAGDDSVAYTVALASTAAVNLGAGNNTFTFVAANTSTVAVNGGSGTADTVIADGALATLLSTVSARTLTGFEVLGLGADSTGTATMSRLATVSSVQVLSNFTDPVTLAAVAAGTTLGYSSATDAADTITYTLADATGETDALTVTLGEADATDGDEFGELNADGIETINIVSTGDATAGEVNLYDITASDVATTLVITGAQDLNLEVSGDATLTSVDGSAATGDLDLAGVQVSADGAELIGGSGDDALTGNTGDDTFTAGDGVDVMVGAGGSDTFTGGAGDDTFDVATFTVGTDLFTITDLTLGASSDVIVFGAADFTAYTAADVDIVINVATAEALGAVALDNSGGGGNNYIIVDTEANLNGFSVGAAAETLLCYASDTQEFFSYDAFGGTFAADAVLVGQATATGTAVTANFSIV